MSEVWNKPQKLISQSNLSHIESLVADLETRWPIELKIVLAQWRHAPTGGLLRLAILIGACIQLFLIRAWDLNAWWHMAPVVVLFVVSFWGIHLFSRSRIIQWIGSRLSTTEERHHKLTSRAHHVFSHLRLYETPDRNAILLYFCVPERSFYLLPDPRLALLLGENVFAGLTESMQSESKSVTGQDKITNMITAMVHGLQPKLAEKLPPLANGVSSNHLSNKVHFE